MTNPTHAESPERPISGSLARVLAEAASGAFVPDQFYVVCRYEPDPDPADLNPFDVHPPCATREAAEQLVEELAKRFPGVAYGIFGPFVGGPEPVRKETVSHITVLTVIDGDPGRTIEIDGRKYDALFYSREAVRKFVVPYYAHVIGPEYAVEVLKSFDAAKLGLMGHLPWSEEVEIPELKAPPPSPGPR